MRPLTALLPSKVLLRTAKVFQHLLHVDRARQPFMAADVYQLWRRRRILH